MEKVKTFLLKLATSLAAISSLANIDCNFFAILLRTVIENITQSFLNIYKGFFLVHPLYYIYHKCKLEYLLSQIGTLKQMFVKRGQTNKEK